jgi:DNA-binding GntR family transcriptional regulator
MGVIQSEPHRGASVRVISSRELLEMYSVRATLEEMAGREAAKRVDEHAIAKLLQMVDEMVEMSEAGDIPGLVAHDVEFHRFIVELSGNRFLLRIWEMIQIHGWTTVTIRTFENRLSYLARRHASIVEALKSGDPDVAGAVLREHIEEFKAEVAKLDT